MLVLVWSAYTITLAGPQDWISLEFNLSKLWDAETSVWLQNTTITTATTISTTMGRWDQYLATEHYDSFISGLASHLFSSVLYRLVLCDCATLT